MNPDSNVSNTLYVGNLNPQASEGLIHQLFAAIGPVRSCKMISNLNGLDPYCFVEFFQREHAVLAQGSMNACCVLGKEIKVNWATQPGGAKKTFGQGHQIFVGDLAPETTSEDLKIYFGKIAEVVDARVMQNFEKNKSKGYGFVSFNNYEDARDIVEKRSVLTEALHGRSLRCHWASRNNGGQQYGKTWGQQYQQTQPQLDFDTIVNLTSPTNCTVYLGGCMSGISEQLMKETFSPYGTVTKVRVFPDKGFAFVTLDTHDNAARSIVALHQSQLEGYQVKCSWGKEGGGQPGYYQQQQQQQQPWQQQQQGPPQHQQQWGGPQQQWGGQQGQWGGQQQGWGQQGWGGNQQQGYHGNQQMWGQQQQGWGQQQQWGGQQQGGYQGNGDNGQWGQQGGYNQQGGQWGNQQQGQWGNQGQQGGPQQQQQGGNPQQGQQQPPADQQAGGDAQQQGNGQMNY